MKAANTQNAAALGGRDGDAGGESGRGWRRCRRRRRPRRSRCAAWSRARSRPAVVRPHRKSAPGGARSRASTGRSRDLAAARRAPSPQATPAGTAKAKPPAPSATRDAPHPDQPAVGGHRRLRYRQGGEAPGHGFAGEDVAGNQRSSAEQNFQDQRSIGPESGGRDGQREHHQESGADGMAKIQQLRREQAGAGAADPAAPPHKEGAAPSTEPTTDAVTLPPRCSRQ